MGAKIKAITAEEMYRRRGNVGLQVTVLTEDGSRGVHMPSSGISVGQYEAAFLWDGGDRWFGRGVLKAVENVQTIIAPKLVGMDVTQQGLIDDTLIKLDGTPDKSRLGANAVVGVSLATLKAAARSSGLPLYRYIGGVNACTLPCPRIGFGVAGTYRDPGETRLAKPSYELAAFDVKTFSESVYVSEIIRAELMELLKKRYGPVVARGRSFLTVVKDDRDALEAITTAVENTGYKGKAGIVIDCAAGCYYETDKERYVGMFWDDEKTREDVIEMYKDFVATYPIISLEDPLHEDDFEGHATLTKELGIEIVGDDLFVTDPERVRTGIELGAANCMVLKIPQIGTVSEAMDAVQLMQRHDGAINPCASRGDPSAELAVGINAGQVRGNANVLLQIERELGRTAKFLGREAYKTQPLS
ncbi:MAG: phosphopyruvate hydratase [Candidatus Bathyarchaeota archaeon]|nr:phosphopyruvate hydratase [Candidatus Bathyarchaeota archaeon]